MSASSPLSVNQIELALRGTRRTGGYEGLTRAMQEMQPAEVVEVITESKLAGRGGAGFPTGLKWQAVAEAPGQSKNHCL